MPADEGYDLGSLALGYLWETGTFGVGVRGSLGLVPASLEGEYGSRWA